MNKFKKPIVALCYDFDLTLSKKDMQEYGFIEKLGIPAEQFWQEVNKTCNEYKLDRVLGYMFQMVESYKQKNLRLIKQDLVDCGKTIELFDGVKTWFKRINDFGKKQGIVIEHYIISSGIKEIIEGSPIAKEFKEIYASNFIYDKNNMPIWPGQALNYTNKTQFLFRVNKGFLDTMDDRINDSMKHDNRRIPFKNLIYIGDSETDIPCMRLVVKNGGFAIGVYRPNAKMKTMIELLDNNRINFFVPANYSKNSEIENLVKEIIFQIKHRTNIEEFSKQEKQEMIKLKKEIN